MLACFSVFAWPLATLLVVGVPILLYVVVTVAIFPVSRVKAMSDAALRGRCPRCDYALIADSPNATNAGLAVRLRSGCPECGLAYPLIPPDPSSDS
jgi:hypothetical protein